MKKSGLRRTSALKRKTALTPGKPLARSPRKKKAGTPKAFKHRRDPVYTAWIKTQPCILADHPKHTCWGPIDPMHVKSRGAGGDDRGNELPGCRRAHDEQRSWKMGLHSWAEKYGIDLALAAQGYEWLYHRQTGN